MLSDDLQTRIQKLTDGQKECLYLVSLYHSSKEVARLLNISSHTVDQRLKRAIAILGVTNRAEAARVFMEHEKSTPETQTYDHLVCQKPDIPAAIVLTDSHVALEDNVHSSAGSRGKLYQHQERFFAEMTVQKPQSSMLSMITGYTVENKLSGPARIGVMFGILILALVCVALLVSIAEGFSRLH
jgi:DNA-binding CsgD family transcriptional regulator